MAACLLRIPADTFVEVVITRRIAALRQETRLYIDDRLQSTITDSGTYLAAPVVNSRTLKLEFGHVQPVWPPPNAVWRPDYKWQPNGSKSELVTDADGASWHQRTHRFLSEDVNSNDWDKDITVILRKIVKQPRARESDDRVAALA